MTKRWSGTVSDLTKTKRQASKDQRSRFAAELRRLDELSPEATFGNGEDMLRWLNDDK